MIRVGVLGTGFGETHVETLKRTEGFEVAAVFGRDRSKLDQIVAECQVAVTSDVEAVINDPEIDLISVCLPTQLHTEYAVAALAAGKHVLVETPAAESVAKAEEIAQAADKHQRLVFVDQFIKFSAPHRLARDLLAGSELGPLKYLRAYNTTSPRWGDLGLERNIDTFHIHLIDFAVDLLGLPVKVDSIGVGLSTSASCSSPCSSMTSLPSPEFASGLARPASSSVTTVLGYEGAAVVLESLSWLPESTAFEIGFEAVCERGTMRFAATYGEHDSESFTMTTDGGGHRVLDVPEVDDYQEVMRHVAACISANKRSPLIDIQHAVDTLRVREQVSSRIV